MSVSESAGATVAACLFAWHKELESEETRSGANERGKVQRWGRINIFPSTKLSGNLFTNSVNLMTCLAGCHSAILTHELIRILAGRWKASLACDM